MECIVDSRENKILDILKKKENGFSFSQEYLNLGDFIIRDENKQEIIFERKTWSDLHASLQDSRYREQRSRLLLHAQENPSVKICYLIEGKFNSMYTIEKKAILRLQFAYHVHVVYSSSLEDTIQLLSLFMHLPNLDSYFNPRNLQIDQVESRVSCRTKKNFDDPSIFFQETLCCLKGMTPVIAHEISKEWKSLSHFFQDFFSNPKEWEKTFSSIEYKTKQNNSKKINKNLIEKVKMNLDLFITSTTTSIHQAEGEEDVGT